MLGDKIEKLIQKDRDIPEMIQDIVEEDSSVIYICEGPDALNLPLLIMKTVLQMMLDSGEFDDFKIVPLDKDYQKKVFMEIFCAERLKDMEWIQIEHIDGEHTYTMWIWR